MECARKRLHFSFRGSIYNPKRRGRGALAAHSIWPGMAPHYRPQHRAAGPSWLTFLGHSKNSLWSLDLFRTESILLKSHWVLVVMDQFSRRLIGFAVQPVTVDGSALCRLFNQAIAAQGQCLRLSFDHDPLFQFHRWQANLRVLGI